MGWPQPQDSNRSRAKSPYCPFRKFCVFLHGEEPESVLAEREYLRDRVDTLEFAMDFTNHQFKQLQEHVKELEEETEHLQKELSNALQAPFTKYKKKDPAESTAKRGAPIGHEGHSRSNPEVIDKTLDVYLDRCPICGGERISPCNHTTEHIQEDFEDGKLTATRFVHCYYWCPDCKHVVHGWGENEIPNAFIGPDVRAKTSFMRHEIKSSYNDTRRTLECFGDLKLSNAALVGFDKHMTERGKPLYDALKQSLPNYQFMHADETGWKRDWLWFFTNPFITFFDIDESRGSQVVIDHLGAFYHGVLITDFWNAYRNKVGAFAKQKCLVHFLRDIKELLDAGLQKHPDAECFLLAVKELIQDAISLHGQHSVLSVEAYRSGRKEILKRFRELYRNAPLSHHESDNIRKRLIAFKNELFTFLKYPIIEPTNNFAEQAIRNAVLLRKLIFGNMTTRGKMNVALAMTIIRTAMQRALSPIEILRDIAVHGTTSELLARFGLPAAMPQAP